MADEKEPPASTLGAATPDLLDPAVSSGNGHVPRNIR